MKTRKYRNKRTKTRYGGASQKQKEKALPKPASKPKYQHKSPPKYVQSAPASKPASVPASVPASKPVSKPASVPASVPASKPVSKPASVPESKPVSKPVSVPASKPVSPPKSPPKSPVKEAEQSKNPPKSPSRAENVPKNVKLNLQDTPDTYNPKVELEFWSPLFPGDELTELKTRIQEMMQSDCKSMGESAGWNLCKINKRMVSTYFIPANNDPIVIRGQRIFELKEDYTKYNVELCAAFILFGILSKKMENQDYILAMKGGKAIQMALSKTSRREEYNSEDIDLLIIPKGKYDVEKCRCLSAHVGYLMQWFLETPPEYDPKECNYTVSVMPPDPKKPHTNQFIYKLSYIKNTGQFKAFSDIDFSEITREKYIFFSNLDKIENFIPELNQSALFCFPNIQLLLDEKVHYYMKYDYIKYRILYGAYVVHLHKLFEIKDEPYKLYDCERFILKFKPAIVALTNAMSKDRSALYIRLNKIGIDDYNIQRIMQEIYTPVFSYE